jgi:hypothetical protein
MLRALQRIDDSLETAQRAAAHVQSAEALDALDRALDIAEDIREQRNAALQDATATWYNSWFPRVAQANGRSFHHELDDVKDHRPDRTVDMSYLVYRELLLPFGNWVNQLATVRNDYAAQNQQPRRDFKFDWQNTSDGRVQEYVVDEED